MKAHPPNEVRKKLQLAKKVAFEHFGKGIKNIGFNPAGNTNFVFDMHTREGDYIIRIGQEGSKHDDFIKEQWATHHAKKIGIPVPDILEVGNTVIPMPYMIQKKIKGKEAVE